MEAARVDPWLDRTEDQRLRISPATGRLALLIQQNGDAVAGEVGGGGRFAGADGGGMNFASGQAAVYVIGELAQISRFVAHDCGRTLAGVATIEFAGAAGVSGGGDVLESARDKLRDDLLFLLFEAGGGNGSGEIFDGEIHVAGLDDGDAEGVEFAVHEIGAMGSGVHPLGMQAGDAGTFRDIFGDEAEAGTGVASTVLHRRFAGKLVREGVALSHEKSVLMGGGGEVGVPMERRESGGGAIAIGGVEQG